ncbi:hypothetical protein OAS44_07810 [Flavobacteriaceae bacterium]|nr:hypothetical protein [Flavobacteriaceae bacterium]
MNKIKILYDQYGLGIVTRLLKSGLIRLGIVYETLYLFKIALDANDISKRLKKYDSSLVKSLTLTDFDYCESLSDQKKLLFKKRLESLNYKAFGIFKDTKLVYYSWVSFKSVSLPFNFKKTLFLDETEALLEDAFCDPNYRRRGYHSMVNIVRLKTVLENGKKNAVVTVLADNKPAIRVQKKSGFLITKKIKLTRVLNKERIKHIAFND